MSHENGNPADVRERLYTYVRALALECSDRDLEAILDSADSLAGALERLRKQLASGFRGDFLAFRLWQGFEAQLINFRQPSMERQPFPAAQFGAYQPAGPGLTDP